MLLGRPGVPPSASSYCRDARNVCLAGEKSDVVRPCMWGCEGLYHMARYGLGPCAMRRLHPLARSPLCSRTAKHEADISGHKRRNIRPRGALGENAVISHATSINHHGIAPPASSPRTAKHAVSIYLTCHANFRNAFNREKMQKDRRKKRKR